jgi:hypothetical protein
MPLNVERLGASPGEPFCTELIGWWPDATAIAAHLSRLPDLTLVAKKSWILTDDLELYFEYRGYRFVLESPFSRLWLTALSPDMPEAVFRDLEQHVIRYRAVWPRQYLSTSWHTLRLPREPPAAWRS